MRGSGFLLGVLCSGLDLNKKFRQYCKVRWENNTAELTTADPRAIEEFYPEFPELYDYFFSLGEVKEPAHPINEGYLNVSKIIIKERLRRISYAFWIHFWRFSF